MFPIATITFIKEHGIDVIHKSTDKVQFYCKKDRLTTTTTTKYR